MCGIVGEISLVEPINREIFVAMCAELAHRGPDGQGQLFLNEDKVALGHRRLSIIDLSDAGRQPMSNEDDSCWVVFNGEVYNFQPLRQELVDCGHIFKSRTDTEVILHAYEEWGRSCVQRFRGMFAFGLWDQKRQLLWLVRDRVGIKPLYYYWDGLRFIFASEVKAIVKDRTIPRQLDMNALSAYLAYGYVPFDLCIFRNFKKLPAGWQLTFTREEVKTEQYWDVQYSGSLRNEPEAIATLKAALSEAVRSHLISDVPLGLFLSGGVDSSAIAAFMQQDQSGPVRTFTIGFDVSQSDETPYAREVARYLKTEHHERVLSFSQARRLIPEFVRIYDEPFHDSSCLPTYLVSELARRQVTVALAGDGGDEVFAGYKWYDRFLSKYNPLSARDGLRPFMVALSGLLGSINRRWQRLGRLAVWTERASKDPREAYFVCMGLLPWSAQRALFTQAAAAQVDADPLWLFRRFYRKDWPAIIALQYLDLKTYLVDDILTKVDRASMAHSLEVRPPLLDHHVIELAYQISCELMYKNGERKYLFKESLRGLLPEETLSTRKKGFSVPIVAWFEQGLREQARALLVEGVLVKRGVFQAESLSDYVTTEHAGRIWLLLSLEMWARQWLEDWDVVEWYAVSERHLWEDSDESRR
jgi:asparagine synthase (glutamine-hydrolysing)